MTQPWRRFLIYRIADPTGVSGTGNVAQGMVLHDGRVVVAWFGEHATVTIHASIESVRAVHLHGDLSVIRWVDPICFACGTVLELFEIVARHCHECGAGQGTGELHMGDEAEPSLGTWRRTLVVPAPEARPARRKARKEKP